MTWQIDWLNSSVLNLQAIFAKVSSPYPLGAKRTLITGPAVSSTLISPNHRTKSLKKDVILRVGGSGTR